MRIVCLNIWGGRLPERLIQFFQSHTNIDVFCLQEVYHEAHGKDTVWTQPNHDSLNDIKHVLPEHTPVFHPHWGDWWGLSIFVRKNIEIDKTGEKFVHLFPGYNEEKESQGITAKNLQFVQVTFNNKPLTLINFHGLWNGKGKTDCEERIEQSKKIVEFIQSVEDEIIFCGDFNLLPDTQSMQLIEAVGLINLIKEYGITSTRTTLYTKPEKFADYMFVSKGLEVKEFKVLPDEVSDHAPLFLEIQ